MRISPNFIMPLAIALLCNIATAQVQNADRIKADAYAKHPGDIAEGSKESNTALVREAEKESAGKLSPKVTAALLLIGYYAKNVFGISKVCAEKGISVSTYSDHFAEMHRPLIVVASKYTDTSALIARQKSDATTVINAKNELDRLATARGTDLKGICDFVRINGAQLAEGAQFKRIFPELYETLVRTTGR